MTSLLDEKGKASDKTIQMDNRTTVTSKGSNGDRLVLLALEKEQDQKSDKFQDQRSERGSLPKQEPGTYSQLVETRRNKQNLCDVSEGLARKARMSEREREMAVAKSSQGTSFRNLSSVGKFTKDSRSMDKTETAENGHTANIALSVHSTPENTVKLVHEGKSCVPRRDSKSPEKPTFPTEADERADRKDRSNDDNGVCRQGSTSQPEVKVANK